MLHTTEVSKYFDSSSREVGMEQLWTVQQLAAFLQVPVATVYAWRREEARGPKGIRVGKHVRYRAADVEAWLATQGSR